jgi:hypothetical protein
MFRFVWFTVAWSAMACASAWATVLVPAELGELSREADLVIHGRVVSIEARQPEGGRRVERLVTLDVEQSLKGGERAVATFVSPGGELGRYRTIMVGAPEFVVGEEVVVFLGVSRSRGAYVLGLNQGVYRVATLGPSGPRLVMSPVVHASHGPAPATVERGAAGGRAMPLAEFVEAVRTAIADGARPREHR